MRLLTSDEANYIANKYFHLTSLQNKLGKVNAIVKMLHESDDNFYKVVVALCTDNFMNDKFYDLDEFCEIVEIEYNEE